MQNRAPHAKKCCVVLCCVVLCCCVIGGVRLCCVVVLRCVVVSESSNTEIRFRGVPGITFGRFVGPQGGKIIIHRNDYKRFRKNRLHDLLALCRHSPPPSAIAIPSLAWEGRRVPPLVGPSRPASALGSGVAKESGARGVAGGYPPGTPREQHPKRPSSVQMKQRTFKTLEKSLSLI